MDGARHGITDGTTAIGEPGLQMGSGHYATGADGVEDTTSQCFQNTMPTSTKPSSNVIGAGGGLHMVDGHGILQPSIVVGGEFIFGCPNWTKSCLAWWQPFCFTTGSREKESYFGTFLLVLS